MSGGWHYNSPEVVTSPSYLSLMKTTMGEIVRSLGEGNEFNVSINYCDSIRTSSQYLKKYSPPKPVAELNRIEFTDRSDTKTPNTLLKGKKLSAAEASNQMIYK